jgi:hypothetical protein
MKKKKIFEVSFRLVDNCTFDHWTIKDLKDLLKHIFKDKHKRYRIKNLEVREFKNDGKRK